MSKIDPSSFLILMQDEEVGWQFGTSVYKTCMFWQFRVDLPLQVANEMEVKMCKFKYSQLYCMPLEIDQF